MPKSKPARPLSKQLIERLNRTYKFHARSANGFNSTNVAVAYTTLFVTYYNFLRANMLLGYAVPILRAELGSLQTIQERWCKIIDVDRMLDAPVLDAKEPYSPSLSFA